MIRCRQLIFLLLVAALACRAQDDPTCLTRIVPVTVVDRDGNLPQDLRRTDFRARVGKQPASIRSLQLDRSPRRVVILLDTSGSMLEPKAKWDVARQVAADMVYSLPRPHSLALITFSANVEDSLGFDHDRTDLVNRLRAFEDRGMLQKGRRTTAVLDAVRKALELLDTPQLGDSLYVVSDGEDNTSRSSFDDAERLLLTNGVRLFLFLLREPSPFPFRHGPQDFQELARTSGGRTVNFFARRPERGSAYPAYQGWWSPIDEVQRAALAQAARQIYSQVIEFHVMQLEMPAGASAARKWPQLKLEMAGSKTPSSYTIQYPSKLPGCKTASLRYDIGP